MSIKPDHWIRKMALEHKMIEPFEEKLVRKGVISYGLSSFGYDIRVANEFRIFTASTGQLTVVDPKTLDERALVPYEGDICIIPPNSFALARSVEYFRMPRNVMGLCLGKCVSGDTRVVDAETGAYRPIRDWTNAQRTVGLNGWQMQIADINRYIPQGRKPVFLLTTKTGLKIRATANHPFRQLHGWTALSELKVGDRIAVAREIPVFGKTPLPDWEAALLGLMISEGQCSAPQHSPTFTSSDPVLIDLLRTTIAQSGLGTVTYKGRYGYRLVNRAGRGGIAENNRTNRWLASYGLNVTAEHKFVPEAIFTAPKESVRLFLQTLFAGDGSVYRHGESYFVEYYSKSRRLVEDVHHLLLRFGIFSLIREKVTPVQTNAYKIQITDREQILRFANQIGFYPDSIKQKRLSEELLPALQARPLRLRSNFDTLPSEAWAIVRSAATDGQLRLRGMSLRSNGIKVSSRQSVPLKAATKVATLTQCKYLESLATGPIWDVVQSIEAAGEEEVYDLSVPDLHNFVANDLIVHNSTYARAGIVTNFTPFEPAWEGFVTIEISNTTPLPAKIYANEGIAQVLFFEGEEPEVTYADRQGKYQAQTGITLPKV